jgi:hypothetical protein
MLFRSALSLLAASFLVVSCTSAAHLRNDMQDSKELYKTCLANNPGNPNACETERLVFQADVDAYSSVGKSPH